MSTYITVEYERDALLRQSRQNMDSKRSAQAERDARKPYAAELSAWVAAQRRQQLLRSRLPSRARREEPGAYIVQRTPRHQRLWLYCSPYIFGLSGSTVSNLQIIFFSGDATQSLTYISPDYPVINTTSSAWFSQIPGACQEATIGCNLVTLPIDRNSCIVCVTYSDRIYTGSFRAVGPPNTPVSSTVNIFISSTSAPNQRQTRGFYIGKSSVKEVTVPLALRNLLEAGAAPTSTSPEYPAFTLGTDPPIGAIWDTNIGYGNLVWDGGGQGFEINNPLQRFASCAFTDISAIQLESLKNSIIDPVRPAKPVYKAVATFDGWVVSNPAVYSLLLDYAEGSNLDYSGDYNSVLYDFVGRQLVPGRSLSPSGIDDKFLLEYIGPQLLEGDNTYFPPVSGEDDPTYWKAARGYKGLAAPLATMPTTLPDDAPTSVLSKIYWLDWDIPGYNRRKLIELGFSASALAP